MKTRRMTALNWFTWVQIKKKKKCLTSLRAKRDICVIMAIWEQHFCIVTPIIIGYTSLKDIQNLNYNCK